jgi:hypothetical protein
MAAQLISYDLRKPGRDYSSLYEAIKQLGSWWHCLESIWIVQTALSTAHVRDALKAHIDGNDGLVVLSLAGGWATYGLSEECNNWLRNNL